MSLYKVVGSRRCCLVECPNLIGLVYRVAQVPPSQVSSLQVHWGDIL